MTVVLDTNVVVSGIFWSGPPHEILKAWQNKQFKIAISLEIIDEYRRVGQELGNRFPKIQVNEIIDLIAFNSDIYSVKTPAAPVCRDPDDDKFLFCGLAANATYIVTGDKLLLELNGYGGIKIIKPGLFLSSEL
jgi:putative PIN family toxin of toxin-antitoxin system